MPIDRKHRLAGAFARAPFVLPTLLSLSRPDRFLILSYHRVNDDAHPFFGGTSTALFREQMRAVVESFTVCPLDELIDQASSGRVPRNAVAITFDDGYRDNYTHAFPVLRELGLPAMIYLVTGALDDNLLIWHDRVFDAIHRTDKSTVSFRGSTLSLATEADRHEALAAVLPALRVLSPGERDERVGELHRSLGIDSQGSTGWEKLSWDEVREMRAHGIRFGAHTLDHPILSHVDADEARRQIRASKARIEEELDQSIAHFAYPNGRAADFTPETQRILREEGFRSAVTTMAGPNDCDSDFLSLRRNGVWGDDPYLSVMRLARTRMSS